MTKRGHTPYVLDDIYGGELPKSSINVCVTFNKQSRYHKEHIITEELTIDGDGDAAGKTDYSKGGYLKTTDSDNDKQDEERKISRDASTGIQKIYKLQDYLSIPPPRMKRIDVVKKKLIQQYASDFDTLDDIESLFFIPFHQFYNQNDRRQR